ncbi:hypothetical protein [Methanolobus bombayensis]|uniref:hypothetical protein n=1 Tax=Methanolobus bombayensis TaxID=38023 RepID=UPI001AE7E47A|nr:hypothetical protein [Methanolobus bombayensis]MBP1908282.1 hypothetical protein [Methanolobus bombayensis]
MDKFTSGDSNISDDIISQLPKSLQLMVEIEDRANAKLRLILKDIEEGKTTLEEVKKKRGI